MNFQDNWDKKEGEEEEEAIPLSVNVILRIPKPSQSDVRKEHRACVRSHNCQQTHLANSLGFVLRRICVQISIKSFHFVSFRFGIFRLLLAERKQIN